MNSERLQQQFRWATPITLFLLSCLIGAYMVILNNWKDEIKEIKVCVSNFEKEVKAEYIPRKEFDIWIKSIDDKLTDIKNALREKGGA